MLPGFVVSVTPPSVPTSQGVWLAGPWDSPAEGCTGIGTDAVCVVPVLWCTDHYRCYSREKGYYLHDYGPYPCGGCISTEGW